MGQNFMCWVEQAQNSLQCLDFYNDNETYNDSNNSIGLNFPVFCIVFFTTTCQAVLTAQQTS